MRGLQVWSEGRKRRVGAALKGLPWVARGGKHGKGAAAAAAAAAHERGGGPWNHWNESHVTVTVSQSLTSVTVIMSTDFII